MKQESPTERLLNDLLHNSGRDAGESSARLAALAKQDPSLAGKIREELEFSEMIRQILLEGSVEESEMFPSIESEDLSSDELFERVKSGDATERECNRLVQYLWENPMESHRLRRELALDELLFEAVAPSKSGESFVEALETRMWAEVRDDHFIQDLESRLESENVVEFPASRNWKKPLMQLGALAAVVAVGAFVAVTQLGGGKIQSGNVVAEVLKSSGDLIWGDDQVPSEDGKMRSGHYKLASGVVSMRFLGGQEMTIQGPAEFDVTGDSGAFVHSGIALAKSAGKDTDFSLKSKGVSFSNSPKLIGIDARSESSTNTLVFGGDVGVCLTDGKKCREIYEFEAVRADSKHDKLVDIPYQPRAFEKAWELVSGVTTNMGEVRMEMPGAKIEPSKGDETGSMQVFVENESFHSEAGIDIDRIEPGHFASVNSNGGQALQAKGNLRSYLLQLWPDADISQSADGKSVEASLTFDHPVVGLIFSSDRLAASDSLVGTSAGKVGQEKFSPNRGLDDGSDSIILSEDRRTINLRLSGGAKELDQVRVLVALN